MGRLDRLGKLEVRCAVTSDELHCTELDANSVERKVQSDKTECAENAEAGAKDQRRFFAPDDSKYGGLTVANLVHLRDNVLVGLPEWECIRKAALEQHPNSFETNRDGDRVELRVYPNLVPLCHNVDSLVWELRGKVWWDDY